MTVLCTCRKGKLELKFLNLNTVVIVVDVVVQFYSWCNLTISHVKLVYGNVILIVIYMNQKKILIKGSIS